MKSTLLFLGFGTGNIGFGNVSRILSNPFMSIRPAPTNPSRASLKTMQVSEVVLTNPRPSPHRTYFRCIRKIRSRAPKARNFSNYLVLNFRFIREIRPRAPKALEKFRCLILKFIKPCASVLNPP